MKYSPSVIFVKDLEGRYLLVNDEFSRASGIAVDAAVGMTAAECWPDDTDPISGRERQLLEDGVSFVSDEPMTTVDGPRDFMVSRFLIRDEAGTPSPSAGSPRTPPSAAGRRRPSRRATACSTRSSGPAPT